jgi:methanethiol S-methyltransferase
VESPRRYRVGAVPQVPVTTPQGSRLRRWAPVVFAWVCYAAFARSMIYLIAFLANTWVDKTVDGGAAGPVAEAVAVDLTLLGLFVVPHSLMAREGFKAWMREWVEEAERSVYVLTSSLLLTLLLWQWRPLPLEIWTVEAQPWAWTLTGLSIAGWLLALASSHHLGHMTTFGVRPALDRARGRTPVRPGTADRPLVTRGVYALVRHPMYLGFLVGIWSTPVMSLGHLLLAVVLTGYVLVGRLWEERDLEVRYGAEWRRYFARVPAFVPFAPAVGRRRLSGRRPGGPGR